MNNQQGQEIEGRVEAFKEGSVLNDRYELLLPIAAGGMGMVWIARLKGARGFKKLVAVKTILHDMHDSAYSVEDMLTQEANIVSQIRHPNVVETIELGECSGSMYLAMELVQGETLAYVLKAATAAGGLPLNVAVNLIGQVCRGLHAAHELRNQRGDLLGVVHRDVSPQNILVSFSGVAKLADFGIVKVGAEESCTRVGEFKGKFSYMTPEQLQQVEVDRRSDIFCLGIMLYLLTTGDHPFKDVSVQKTCLNIMEHDPAPPSFLVDDYNLDLEPVVLKALAKDRSERYSTAAELCEALEQAVPEAFTAAGTTEVSNYISALLADRMEQRSRLVQQAEAMIEKSNPTTSGIVRRTTTSTRHTTIPIVPNLPTHLTRWGASLFFVSALAGAGALYASLRPVRPATSPPTPAPSASTIAKAVVSEYAPMIVTMGPVPSATTSVPMPQLPTWRAAPRKSKVVEKVEETTEAALDVASGIDAPTPEAAPTPTVIPSLPTSTPAVSSPPPAAPQEVGPKNVPSKVGHALLAINPHDEPYRPFVASVLRDAVGFNMPVRICVNPSGLVKSVQVLRPRGDIIDKKIISALSRWRYRPLLIDGRPKTFCYPIVYSF